MKSYRDLWLWLGAALLTASAGLLAIALAYFTKVQRYSLFTSWWTLAAVIVFLLAFACFLGAIKGVAFPPWEETSFPKIKADIYGAMQVSIPRTAMGALVEPFLIWFYSVRITSLEKEQNASLIIRPFYGLAPGPGPFAEVAGCHANLEQLIKFYNLYPDNFIAQNPLPETILLSPATSATGDLIYMVTTLEWMKLAEPRQVRLVIQDLVSGKAMEKLLEQDLTMFSTKDMSPAKPSIRMREQDQGGGASGSPETDEAAASTTEVPSSESSESHLRG